MAEQPERALFLSDRCDFTLRHCGRPMDARGSRNTWQGQYPEGSSTTENEYRCPVCGTTAQVKVIEPDVASTRGAVTRPVKVLDPNCPTCRTGPGRETTGMVCQTCGTDYGAA